MRTAQDKALDAHLDLWARKAGYVFGLGKVAREFVKARDRDPEAIMFLRTASEITDLLVDVAHLLPPDDEDLPEDGATRVEVPHHVVLAARTITMHWRRQLTRAPARDDALYDERHAAAG